MTKKDDKHIIFKRLIQQSRKPESEESRARSDNITQMIPAVAHQTVPTVAH